MFNRIMSRTLSRQWPFYQLKRTAIYVSFECKYRSPWLTYQAPIIHGWRLVVVVSAEDVDYLKELFFLLFEQNSTNLSESVEREDGIGHELVDELFQVLHVALLEQLGQISANMSFIFLFIILVRRIEAHSLSRSMQQIRIRIMHIGDKGKAIVLLSTHLIM